LPGTVVPAQLILIDVLPLPVIDVGVNVAVAPVGSPLAANVTTPMKPFRGDTVTLYVLYAFCAIVRDAGVADSEKSADPVELTTSVTCAGCCRVPLLPVMVMG
jgi:hypothetical protein